MGDAAILDVRCPTALDLNTVGEVAAALTQALSAPAIALDGGAVARIDAAGAQLLYAFMCAARARHVAVTWRAASPTLCAAARTLGLADPLGLADATSTPED